MSDKPTKTAGQVAYEAWVASLNYPLNQKEIWNRVAAAVLAHAAPKWHPVSEPLPKDGRYWVRRDDGYIIESLGMPSGHVINIGGHTHWQGPIEPPPFQEKP